VSIWVLCVGVIKGFMGCTAVAGVRPSRYKVARVA